MYIFEYIFCDRGGQAESVGAEIVEMGAPGGTEEHRGAGGLKKWGWQIGVW